MRGIPEFDRLGQINKDEWLSEVWLSQPGDLLELDKLASEGLKCIHPLGGGVSMCWHLNFNRISCLN